MKLTPKDILPTLPKALKLPTDPSLTWEDLIPKDDMLRVFVENSGSYINVEEKVDGSSLAMALLDEHPVIRTKDRILSKGELGKTPSQKQYANVWNWFYDNHRKFRRLEEAVGPCSVYGEWMVMQHGLEYDKLPSWFIAFDVYCHDRQEFLTPLMARGDLVSAGFTTSQKLDYTPRPIRFLDYVELVDGPSQFTTKGNREGIYIKISNDNRVTHRFKMVRNDFVRGALFNDEKVIKNRLEK